MLRKVISLTACLCILALALLLGGCGEYTVTQAGTVTFENFVRTASQFNTLFGIRDGYYYYEKGDDLPEGAPSGTALVRTSVADGSEAILGYYDVSECGRGCITRDAQGQFYALSSCTDYRLWALEGDTQRGRVIACDDSGDYTAYYCDALNGKLYTTVTQYKDGASGAFVGVDIGTGEQTVLFTEQVTDTLKQHLYSTAVNGDCLYVYAADTQLSEAGETTERYVLCFDKNGKQTDRYSLPPLTDEEKVVLGSDTEIHVEGEYLIRQCTEGMILYHMEDGALKEVKSVQQAGMYLFDTLRFEGDAPASRLAFWNRLSPEIWVIDTKTTAIKVIKVEGLPEKALSSANDGSRHFSQDGYVSLMFHLPEEEGSPVYNEYAYICDISAYL